MDADARDDTVSSQQLSIVLFSKEETTLAVLPFFSLEYGNQRRSCELTYDTKLLGPGITANLSWQVVADPTYGFPDAFDRKVFKIIEQVATNTGPPVRNPVLFSLRQILEALGLAPFPSHYARVRSSIRRIAAVTVKSHLTYHIDQRTGQTTQTFHLFDTVSFKDATQSHEITTDEHWIAFGSWYLQTLNHEPAPSLDPVYFRQLRHPLTTRLYEMLAVKFGKVLRDQLSGWRISYTNLCRILPSSPVSADPQRHLDVAHQPLVDTGFLADVVWEHIDNTWLILYRPGPRAREMYGLEIALPAAFKPKIQALAPPPGFPEPRPPAVMSLTDRSMPNVPAQDHEQVGSTPASSRRFRKPSPNSTRPTPSGSSEESRLLMHWGLTERPFDTTPNPRFFFPTSQHHGALFKLRQAITTHAGAVLLTGDVGCGKTLLIRTFVYSLEADQYSVALLTNPRWNGTELLREILYQLGHPAESKDKNTILRSIEQLWLESFETGKHTVLIIDEAQLIEDAAAFEELRLLLNFQMDDRNLVTLVLTGQPELAALINAIPQFDQRMMFRHHIRALSPDETHAYITHRLEIAKAKRVLFSENAVRRVYELTGGVPRRINTVCSMALLEGWIQSVSAIEAELINQATQV